MWGKTFWKGMIRMIVKLAFRNMKKSMSDYAVYFITLIIGISVFYVFNAITDQTVVIKIFKNEDSIRELMRNTLSGASVIVSMVLAFLVVYASNFLMKRRKKEFGIYLLLGMGKKKIAGILMVETVIIGIISLLIGLGIGIVLSQAMSVLVASLFEVDMSEFTFDISVGAVGKTVMYFLIMFALVLLLDLAIVGKSRLLHLLNAERRVEKNTVKNPWICLVVFVVAAVVLGHAYWMVTANAEKLDTTVDLVKQIVKGIISTFLIFWSISGILIFLSKLRKKSYLKDINAFTVKEISSRVNTNVFAGSIICLLLFITICIFSSSFSINKAMNDNLKILVPRDVSFVSWYDDGLPFDSEQKTIKELFDEADVDTEMFRDVTEITVYSYYIWKEETNDYGDGSNVFANGGTDILKLSDYNRLAKAYNLEQFELADDEYLVISNYDYTKESYNKDFLEKGHVITLGGKEYHPKYKECKDGFLDMTSNPSNLGFTVVPDQVADENLHPYNMFYIADYNTNYKKSVEDIDKYVNSNKFSKKMSKFGMFVASTRTQIYQDSIGLTALVVFLGLYLGIIFILASSALLSLKELTQAADNREKYRVLRKIGVDQKMIHRSLLTQNLIFFGIPLLLAIVHSIFGIQVCVYIIEVFGKSGLVSSIIFTSVVLLAVYAVYFVVTYRCSRRIIDE